MEDFEFSVEISDRDWDCFFTTCEECNLLPPSLAGLDDSGMSDFDDTASLLAKGIQKIDIKAGASEAEQRVESPLDGLPHCQESPVENYLSKHGVGGMESVLSGSEEDIHLQCVNVFFERLKDMTEAESSQVRAGSAGVGESQQQQQRQQQQRCSGGKAASSSSPPENSPKLNCVPARGEAAAGRESAEPVHTISDALKTGKKVEPGSSFSPEAAARGRSAQAETTSSITEQASVGSRVSEAARPSQTRDSADRPQSNGLIQQDLSKSSSDTLMNPEVVVNGKREEDPSVLQSDKASLQEWSPCSSIRRRRKKRRRLSAEPGDLQDAVRTSDSEEEQCLWRGATGLCAPDRAPLLDAQEPALTPCSGSCSLRSVTRVIKPADLSVYTPACDTQHHFSVQSSPGRCHAMSLAGNDTSSKQSGSQNEDRVKAASNIRGSLIQEKSLNLTGTLKTEPETSRSEDLMRPLITPLLSLCSADTESVKSLPNEHFTSGNSSLFVPQNDLQPQREKTGKHEDGDVSSTPQSQGRCSGNQTEDGVNATSYNSGNLLQANEMSPAGTLKTDPETSRSEDLLISPSVIPLLDTELLSNEHFRSGSSSLSVPQDDSQLGGKKETLVKCEDGDGDVSPAAQSEGGQPEDSVKAVSNNDDMAPKPGLSLHPVWTLPQQTEGNSEAGNVHTESLHPPLPVSHSAVGDEGDQAGTAECHTVSQSTESGDPTVELGQNDKLSASKSVLAAETGNSANDAHTLREAELQQQLENRTDRYSPTRENTHFPVPAGRQSSSDTENTKPEQLDTRHLTEEASAQVDDSGRARLDERPNANVAEKQTGAPLGLHTSARTEDLSGMKNTTRAESAGSQTFHSGSLLPLPHMKPTGKCERETSRSPSLPVTLLSSICSLDAESATSLYNEQFTDMSRTSSLSITQKDSGPERVKTLQTLAKHEEGGDCRTVSKRDSALEAKKAKVVSKAEREVAADSPSSVFAMSSFWSEMEKLTINDILGLRMMGKAAVPGSLPAVEESEETDGFSLTDSGFFPQLDEPKSGEVNDDVPSDLKAMKSVSLSSSGVMWESEPLRPGLAADIYSEKMMLPSVEDFSQPSLAASSQARFRKMCKNVSVHNLQALESYDCTWKSQTSPTSDRAEPGNTKPGDGDMGRSDSSSSFRISLSGLFKYIFGGKQSDPGQEASADFTTPYTDGESVPETYDHFFSEFDTDTFFCPLITAEEQASEQPVPVFSYSRSATRNLQFPEVYDYFFASSSSDDSSAESDEEDERGPVRVVNRFTRTSSASKLSSDVYDNFFSDGDLRTQNFFWKNTFSFRNISLTGSAVQTQRQTQSSDALVPVRQSGRSARRTVYPMNALGDSSVMFSDDLLHHLEDRISKQLTQRTFSYDDLQAAVSNPRLDTPLLPLKQADMCLVCIAFASWVLKTANPQAGDAWKAALLANVSALSAIGYLRKYVKVEAGAGEKKKPQLKALPES